MFDCGFVDIKEETNHVTEGDQARGKSGLSYRFSRSSEDREFQIQLRCCYRGLCILHSRLFLMAGIIPFLVRLFGPLRFYTTSSVAFRCLPLTLACVSRLSATENVLLSTVSLTK